MSNKIDERRRHSRESTMSGHLPGKLIECSNSRELDAWPLDVSPRGLGLLIKTPLVAGTRFWLALNDREVTLEVVSCQQHLGIDNLYRCGFFVRDADVNLLEIFVSLGLVLPSAQNTKTT